jgi:hypothetical protein
MSSNDDSSSIAQPDSVGIIGTSGRDALRFRKGRQGHPGSRLGARTLRPAERIAGHSARLDAAGAYRSIPRTPRRKA